jgi:hypothetical protein
VINRAGAGDDRQHVDAPSAINVTLHADSSLQEEPTAEDSK